MAKHAFGENTMTLVVVKDGRRLRTVTVSGDTDVKRHFVLDEEGRPIVGGRAELFRQLTRAECEAAGVPYVSDKDDDGYWDMLVPVKEFGVCAEHRVGDLVRGRQRKGK